MVRGSSRRSPLLANSAFSGLDLWSHRVFKTHSSPIVLNSPTLPNAHTLPDLESVAAHQSAPRPPSAAESDLSFTSFGDRESFETAQEGAIDLSAPQFVVPPPRKASLSRSPPPLSTSMSTPEMIELGAPVPLTPDSVRRERRRSWQKTRGTLVNWAKPLWMSDDETSPDVTDESLRIFGVSLQRNRRMREAMPLGSPALPASPMSVGINEPPSLDSDESAFSTPLETPMDFCTPQTSGPLNDIPETPRLEEAMSDDGPQLMGLGFSNVNALQGLAKATEPIVPPTQFAPFSLTIPTTAPPPRPARPVRPTLLPSPSLDSLPSPSTLEELRTLRQAATDLERQVRQSNTSVSMSRGQSQGSGLFRARRKVPVPPLLPEPTMPLPTTPRPTPSPYLLAPALPAAGEASRKIKRKAVPVFLQPAEAISPLRTPEYDTSPRGSISHSALAAMPAPLPIPDPEFSPVQPITPRIASLPFSIPARGTSAHTRESSTADDGVSVTSASGSSSSGDGPSTPSSSATRMYGAPSPSAAAGFYGNKRSGAFMSMLDLSAFRSSDAPSRKSAAIPTHKRTASSGLYAAKGAFMSVLDLTAFKKENDEAVEVVKHKRGLSRFLGRK